MSDMYLDWETKMALKEYANKSYAELMKEQDPDPPEQAGDFYVHGEWVTRYFGPGGDVAIPEGFTRICCGVFQDCEGASDVTGIIIPKSVTRIDDHVFPYCANLKEIRVEAGNPRYCVVDGLLMEKGGMVLHSCPPARSGVLEIPEGVTEIGDSAFACCSNLTEVVIPEGVTRIGWRAFWRCSGLADVTIPKSVTYIDSDVFSDCTNLTRVVIPEDVAHIGWSAFEGCTNLEEIRAEAGNQRFCAIDGMLLERDDSTLYLHTCPAAKSGILEIPEGVNQIAECAFYGCTGLTEVVIPGSMREIGDSAFYGCSGLTEVIIPEGVIRIGDSAFKGCTNLTHVELPQSVCEIGNGAFRGTGMSEEAVRAAYDRAKERDLELEVEAFGRLIAGEDVLDEIMPDISDDED